MIKSNTSQPILKVAKPTANGRGDKRFRPLYCPILGFAAEYYTSVRKFTDPHVEPSIEVAPKADPSTPYCD